MTDRKLDNIVILGGGSAGWLAALLARKVLPTSKITVVDDKNTNEDLMTLAESVPPHFVFFLDSIGIPVSTLVARADATMKIGTKYTGFCGDDSSFFHGFTLAGDYNLSALDNRDFMTNTSILCAVQESTVSPLDNANFAWMTAREGKVTFVENKDIPKEKFVNDPIFRYNSLGNFSVHFDSQKLVDILREEATNRGVSRIVIEQKLEYTWYQRRENSDDIESVKLYDGQVLEADFVFVCSRHVARISPPSKSTSSNLLVDSFISFFEKHEDAQIPAYTDVIAMDYGWVSKIPLQSGMSCSYFFDSLTCSPRDAAKELAAKFNVVVNPDDAQQFYPAYQESPWVANSISFGVAASRIEPLDFSSMWATTLSIMDAMSDTHKLCSSDFRIAEEYNKRHRDRNEQVIAFTHAYYLGGKSGTKFWDFFSDKKAAPELTKNVLTKTEYKALEYSDFVGTLHSLEDWAQVLSGLRLLNVDLYKRVCEANYVEDRVSRYHEMYLAHLQDSVQHCVDHRDFIETLRKQSIV